MSGPEHAPPQPFAEDPDTAGFWEAARRGELALRFCPRCDQPVHFPRAYCDRCPGTATHWRSVRPAATLYSWTRAEHQVHRAFAVPYTIVLVELDDHPGVRLVGSLDGAPELHIGAAMHLVFETLADGSVLPQWHPALPEG